MDVYIEKADHVYIAMPVYKLMEYSDNYSDTSGSLRKFERDEDPANNTDLSIDNSQSFKYKAALVGKTRNHNEEMSYVKDTKIVVTLKYLNKFWRSLSTKGSVNLTKQLSAVFKRSVCWNSYQTKPAKVIKKGKNIYELFNALFQGVEDYLFLLMLLLQVLQMMKQA